MNTKRFVITTLSGLLVAGIIGCQGPVTPTSAERKAPLPLTENEKSPPVVHEEYAVRDFARVTAGAAMKAQAPLVAFDSGLPLNREVYGDPDENGIQQVAERPVSTFSIDVDTGSYTNVRRMLNSGHLPPKGAVRVEELLNYFQYDDPVPQDDAMPFRITTELATTPWNANTRLLRIGIKGWLPPRNSRPAANLVFLIDVSGSMRSPDKLELVKSSLQLLTRQLTANDRVSLVVYAGASGVVLEPTPGDQGGRILAAIQGLEAGGSTHGSAGIELAYAMAEQAFIEEGINRVLLATDGDFNVGTVDHQQLIDLIEQKRGKGIALTTLGFGSGNYNEHLMEQLADHGNGNYAYIDQLNEARRVLVEQMSGTLLIIAKDVKIQVEFNPAQVAEYRLIGYENRTLRREDFRNDQVDAGEIGAGHSLVALYEIALKGSGGERVDPPRYGTRQEERADHATELAHVRLRYKQPQEEQSRLLEQPVRTQPAAPGSDDLRFAAAVAAFGQQLRGGTYLENYSYDAIIRLAQGAIGNDSLGYRGEFLQLLKLAQSL